MRLEPAELFDPDDGSLRSGRVTPGDAVGTVTIEAIASSGQVFRGSVDVRSSKFSDEERSRACWRTWRLYLSRLFIKALRQAPATMEPRLARCPGSWYQQFAILHALLNGGDLRWALDYALQQPHRAWVSQSEPRQAGRPLQGFVQSFHPNVTTGSSSANRFEGPSLPTKHGPRRADRGDARYGVPNRYVRFALEQWRWIAAQVVASAEYLSGVARRRGLATAASTVEELDSLLGHPLFREVSPPLAGPRRQSGPATTGRLPRKLLQRPH